ncbi:MAG: flagellar biosynthesis protein FlgF [Pseudoxanthomonas spadix]|nr:MAG: flagellar biosynthesis protein FlgF [Pseudoxanthomonas spadix]
MDRALYIAMTGASATLKSQATVSHNLANAQTVGFQATLDATQAMPVTGNGLASRVATAQRLVGVSDASGSLSTTGNGMDVALDPGHWFAVQDRNGGTAYTRAGDLKITQNGLLTTSSGLQLLDAGGAPMVIPPNDGMDIGADGTISVIPQGSPASSMTQIGRLQVVQTGTSNLARGEDGLMRQAPGAPAPTPAAGAVLSTGVLENSNVDATGSLVSMIELARQFEMQVRVLHSGDETAQSANSLLRSS